MFQVWGPMDAMDDPSIPMARDSSGKSDEKIDHFSEPRRTGPCRWGPDNRKGRGGHDGGELPYRDVALQKDHFEGPRMQDSVIRKTEGQGRVRGKSRSRRLGSEVVVSRPLYPSGLVRWCKT